MRMFSVSGSLASRDGGAAISVGSEPSAREEEEMFRDDAELNPIKADMQAARIAGLGGGAAAGPA